MALNRVVSIGETLGNAVSGGMAGLDTSVGTGVGTNIGTNVGTSTATGVVTGLGAISSGQRTRWTLGEMIGRSSAMERLFLQMRYLANHLRLALLEGERGTGKRLAAQTLHGMSLHRGNNFVACTAEEFFRDGVFTERLEEARGGTLYLSRVDALNHEQQGRLLHLLGWMQQQHGRANQALKPVPVRRNGESRDAFRDASGNERSEAFRAPRTLLVSSERALRSLVLYGKFRNDLHQQLSAVHLVMPPLRDRRADVPMLVEHFLAQFAKEHGKPMRGTMQDFLPSLLAYAWPGNVRELQNVVLKAALRCEGDWLRRKDVVLSEHQLEAAPNMGHRAHLHLSTPLRAYGTARVARPEENGNGGEVASALSSVSSSFGSKPVQHGADLDPNLDRAIVRHIRHVLESVSGNKLRAARLLGISRSTLYRLLETDSASGVTLEKRA